MDLSEQLWLGLCKWVEVNGWEWGWYSQHLQAGGPCQVREFLYLSGTIQRSESRFQNSLVKLVMLMSTNRKITWPTDAPILTLSDPQPAFMIITVFMVVHDCYGTYLNLWFDWFIFFIIHFCYFMYSICLYAVFILTVCVTVARTGKQIFQQTGWDSHRNDWGESFRKRI